MENVAFYLLYFMWVWVRVWVSMYVEYTDSLWVRFLSVLNSYACRIRQSFPNWNTLFKKGCEFVLQQKKLMSIR